MSYQQNLIKIYNGSLNYQLQQSDTLKTRIYFLALFCLKHTTKNIYRNIITNYLCLYKAFQLNIDIKR